MLTYCMNILMNLLMVAMVFVMLTMSLASGKRVAGVLNEKSTLANPENPVYEVKDGSIEFDNVSFSYNTKAEKPILNDINLKIKSGETIGIIGGTGSSKTSLVNLIARLYDVTEGSVKVGGKDVRDYDIETLRDKVSVPCGFNAKGMPIGMQLIGKSFGEAEILNAAYKYQQAAAENFKDTKWGVKL